MSTVQQDKSVDSNNELGLEGCLTRIRAEMSLANVSVDHLAQSYQNEALREVYAQTILQHLENTARLVFDVLDSLDFDADDPCTWLMQMCGEIEEPIDDGSDELAEGEAEGESEGSN